MNLSRVLSTLTILALSLGFAATSSAEDKPLAIDGTQMLQVVIQDNVMTRRDDPWTRGNSERQRFLVMKDALKRSAKNAKYQGDVKVERYAGGVEDSPQRLTLYVYRWEVDTRSSAYGSYTVQFAMDATLEIDGEVWDMGTFTARSSTHSLGGIDSDNYRPAAERAINQMIEAYRHAVMDK